MLTANAVKKNAGIKMKNPKPSGKTAATPFNSNTNGKSPI
jgi:hypothetical protein